MGRAINEILFDVEWFNYNKDFALYILEPGDKPFVIINPSKEYVRTFMHYAKLNVTSIIFNFFELYKYLLSKEFIFFGR